MDLRPYRRHPARLSDYLPWGALVAPGIVLNKDGAFQRTLAFRGPDLDNIYKDAGGLAHSWPASGPRKLWTVQLGEGHAAAAVSNSRVYVLDYDQQARADTLRCLSLADGRELLLPRFTQPEPEQRLVLEKLGWELPPQPPPRIRSAEVVAAAKRPETKSKM